MTLEALSLGEAMAYASQPEASNIDELGLPELYCISIEEIVGDGTEEETEDYSQISEEFADYIIRTIEKENGEGENPNGVLTPSGNPTTNYQEIESTRFATRLISIVQGFGTTSQTIQPVFSRIQSLSLNRVEENGESKVFFARNSDFFINGDVPLLPSFSYTPGLYHVFVQFDGKLRSYYYEFKNKGEFTCTYANLVDAIVYPTPISGNEYSINISTGANLVFEYQLLTLDNQILFKTEYALKQSGYQSHSVKSENEIPSGLVIHKFTFRDGSIKTILGVKN